MTRLLIIWILITCAPLSAQINLVNYTTNNALTFSDTVICGSTSTTLAVNFQGSSSNLTWSLVNAPTSAAITPATNNLSALISWANSTSTQYIKVRVQDNNTNPAQFDLTTLVIQPTAGPIQLASTNFCTTDPPITLPTTIPTGGVYSISPNVNGLLTNNGGIYTLNPSVLNNTNIGSFTLTYTISDTVQSSNSNSSICQSSSTKSINVGGQIPSISFNPSSFQKCSSSITLNGGTPSGGTYSVVGIPSAISGNQLLPSQLNVGAHILRYSYTDSYGCVRYVDQTIQVTGINLTGSNPNLLVMDGGTQPASPISPTLFSNVQTFSICSGGGSATFLIQPIGLSSFPNYTVSWGDGSPNSTGTLNTSAPFISHQYLVAGIYPVTLILSDPNGCSISSNFNLYYGSTQSLGLSTPGNTTVCLPPGNSIHSFDFEISNWQNDPIGIQYSFGANDTSAPVVVSAPLVNQNGGTAHPRLIYVPSTQKLYYRHFFGKSSCGTNSALGSATYNNSFSVSASKSSPCPGTQSSAAVAPIVISESPTAGIIGPDSSCTNQTVNFSDATVDGNMISYSNGNYVCDTTNKGFWRVYPNNGFTVVSSTMGSDNGFWNAPPWWTNGSNTLKINFSKPGRYRVVRYIGLTGSGYTLCAKDSAEHFICIDSIPNSAILVDSIPRFICPNDVHTSKLKPDSINCGQRTNYLLELLSLTNTQVIRTFNPITGTTRFQPDFSGLGGTYRLRYTATNSCGSSTFWDTVTVRAVPNFGFNTTSTSFCTNLPYVATFGAGIHQISGNTAASAPSTPTYTITPSVGWTQASITNGIPTINFTSYGTYTVTFTYNGLCGTDTAVQTIVLTPLPSANFSGLTNQCAPLSNLLYSTSTPGAGKTISSHKWTITPSTGATFGTPNDSATTLSITGSNLDSTQYTVKLRIIDSFGCRDSITKKVTVYPNPNAVISGIPTNTCAPFSLSATSGSSLSGYPSNKNQSLTYEWTVRDGATIIATGTQNNIQVNTTNTTSTNRVIWIRLKVTNISNCSDIDSVAVTVWPRPFAGIKSIKNSCGPAQFIAIDSSSTFGTNLSSRQWSIAAGLPPQTTWTTITGTTSATTSLLPSPATDSQVYTIRLIVLDQRGCLDTAYQSFYVRAKPRARFGSLPSQACSPYGLSIVDSSASNLTTLPTLLKNWKVIRGTTVIYSGIGIPNLLLTNSGTIDSTYKIRLWVQNSAGCVDSLTKNIIIRPNANAAIQFSGAVARCAPFTFGSSSLSSTAFAQNGAESWTVFSSTGSQISGPHNGTWTYTIANANDSVRVRLIVASNLGCAADTAFLWLKTVPNPTPSFTLSSNSVCSAQDLIISNISPAGHEYRWVLRDSITNTVVWSQGFSTNSQPNSGLYQALVNSSNTTNRKYFLKFIARAGGVGQCKDSISKSIIILPKPDAVIAPIANSCSGSTLNLQSNSLGSGLTCQWTLFMGSTATGSQRPTWLSSSTAQNPTLTIPQWSHPAADSIYTLKLRVVNVFGCVDSATRSFTVYTRSKVTINPVINNCGTIAIPRTATINGPSGRTYTYSWSVVTGGGSLSSATATSPLHTMPVATTDSLMHVLKLVITNQFGCSSEHFDTTWTRARPLSNFTVGTSYCDSSTAVIQNISASNLSADTALTYQWTLIRGPWSTSYTGKQPNILLRNRGIQDSTYSLSLTVSNSIGCKDTTLKTIVVHPDAKATLITGSTTACTPFILDSSIVKATSFPNANGSYTWKIINSTGSVIKSGSGRSGLSDTITAPSTTVTIRFIAAPLSTGCKADSAQVQVSTVPNPQPTFTLNDTAFCDPSSLVVSNIGPTSHQYRWVLTNASTNAVVWSQAFSTTAQPGAGLVNALVNTSNTTAVVYRLKLVARAGGVGQCADSVTQRIRIQPKPDAVIAPIANSCSGSTLNLQSNSLGSGLTCQWTLFMGSTATGSQRPTWLSSSTAQNPTLTIPQWSHPAADSIYTLKLRVVNVFGCVDSATRSFTVYTRSKVTINPVINNCGTIAIPRTATINGPSGRTYTYSWSVVTGGGSLSSATATSPLHTMPVATTDSLMHVLKLVITNQFGCSSEHFDTTWTRARPLSNFTVGTSYCDSSTAVIQNISASNLSADTALTYQWTLIRGPWSTSYTGKQPNILLRNRGIQDSTYSLSLTVSNSIGCKDTTLKTIVVHPDAKATLITGSTTACTPFILDSSIVKATSFPNANGSYTWKIINSTGSVIKSGSGRSGLSDTITAPSTTVTIRFIAAPLSTGCKADSAQVQVSTVPNPQPTFTLNDTAFCDPSSLVVSNIGPTSHQYRWVLTNASTNAVVWSQAFSTTAQPGAGLVNALVNTSNTTAVVYRLKLVARAGGVGQCADSVTQRIRIQPKPDAVIAPIANSCSGSTLNLQSNSLGSGLTCQWTLFMGSTATGSQRPTWLSSSTAQNPTLTIPQWSHPAADSIYTLKLRVVNVFGCVDSATRSFTVYTRSKVTINPVINNCGTIAIPRTATINGPSGRTYTYSWSVVTGGGSLSSATATSPLHTMPVATTDSLMHVLKLVITNQFGCSSEHFDTTWTRARPLSNFTVGTSYCDSSTAVIQNISASNLSADTALTYQWTLIRGPWSTSYTGKQPNILLRNRGVQDSTYTISLIVTNGVFCRDTVSKQVLVRPDAKTTLVLGTLSACTPFKLDSNVVKAVSYQNANSSYYWKILNLAGTIIKTGTGRNGLSHTITTPNTQLIVRFIALPTAAGCKADSAQIQVSTVPNPVPTFSILDPSICQGSDLVVSGIGPVGGYEYRWVLRDSAQLNVLWTQNFNTTSSPNSGLTTALVNQTTTTRIFKLKLITRVGGPGGCLDSLERKIWIYPRPIAGFDSIVNFCTDTAISVLDQSSLLTQRQYQLYARFNNQWHERPGRVINGTTATPTLNFAKWNYGPNATDSIYTLKLSVQSDSLCSDSTIQTFTVYSRPTVTINSLTPQCGPFNDTLSAVVSTPASRVPIYNWSINPSSGILNSWTSQNPTITLPNPVFGEATYSVILSVNDQYSCATSDTIEVTVRARPKAQFTAPDTICAATIYSPLNTSLSNQVDTNLAYSWSISRGNTPGMFVGTTKYPSWALPNSGTVDSSYIVQLIVTNSFGCTDTTLDTVLVHPNANAQLITNNLTNCAPFIINSTRINAQLFTNANSTYTWKTFGSNGQLRKSLLGAASLNDTLKTANDSLLVRLITQSRWGCLADSTETWVYTLPNPDASFSLGTNDTLCHLGSTFAAATSPSAGYQYTWLLRRPGSLAFNQISVGSNLPPTALSNFGILDSLYELKLRAVNLGSGCADSTVKEIIVRPNPVPSIQTSISCGLDTVQINGSAFAGQANADQLISTWTWLIQNQILTGKNISYYFGTSGQYPVKLTTTTNAGCDTAVWDTITVFDYPSANFVTSSSCGIDTVCLGVPFTVTSSSTTNPLSGTITSHKYDFGANGSYEFSTPNFTHTANTPGLLTLKLLIESQWGCRDSIIRDLWVNAPPTAYVAFSIDSLCGPVSPVYSHSDSGLVDSSYFELYTLTNGTKVVLSSSSTAWQSLPVLVPNYRSDTTYYISKSVFNCCGFNTAVDSIVIKTPPVADFAILPDSGCTPMNVLIQLDGLIKGDADSAYIDFGDGNSASYTPNKILQNGSYTYQWGQKNHTYSYNGFNDTTYYITLTVFNECGDSSLSKSIYLQPNTVQAFFQTNITSGCAPLTVSFTNLSFNALNDNWCFNWNQNAQTCGGMSSTQSNPTWTFTQAGTYLVALFVDNGCGYDTAYSTITVFPAPAASASNNGPRCANDTVSFTGAASLSSGWVAGWRWEFGDGDTSALQNPVHVYDSSGIYTVKLVVTSSNGCQDTVTTVVTVLATPDVSFNASNACFNEQPIIFSNSSTAGSGTIVGTAWDFGDGNTSAAFNPSHSYAQPGSYTVKLVHTTSTGCSDSATQIVMVYPTPSLSFQPQLVAGDSCALPQTYSFTNTSTGTIGVFWDFNFLANPGVDTSRLVSPNHTFTQAGIYTVALIGESAFGCKDTLLRQILVRDGVTAAVDVQPLTGCSPLEIRATNLSQFNASLDTLVGLTWDFGDGTVITDTSGVQYHTYATAGTYIVRLTALMASGCSDEVLSQAVTVHPTPEAGFRIDRVNLRTRQMVNLTVTSDPNTQYTWYFGDGTKSNDFEPLHVYDPNQSGLDSLDVCLVATNSFGCSDSTCTTLWLWPAQLDVPNALAPDITYAEEDAVFLPKGHSLKEYELTIFDKWGNIVFVSTSLDGSGIPNEAWNGRLNNIGDPLPMGAYVWKIRAIFDDGTNWLTERTKIGKRDYGTVTLIR